MHRIILSVAAAIVAVLAAQAPGAPSFDAASLKPVQVTGDRYNANLGTAVHGVVTLTNATLSDCLRYAYEITNDAQIAGPDWIRKKGIRFDILAKASPETPTTQLRIMLQTLLTERFKLVLRHEPRQLGFLSLTVGKNGPKLSQAKENSEPMRQPQIPGRIVSNKMSMQTLSLLLSRFMRQTVLDQTGLKGDFEISLVWTPENVHEPAPGSGPGTSDDAPQGPTIFTAVQEQLGLKLESRKAPVDVLVVDHAEKVPLEN
jgi:uncharacterized protein (TIGR03435 family)